MNNLGVGVLDWLARWWLFSLVCNAEHETGKKSSAGLGEREQLLAEQRAGRAHNSWKPESMGGMEHELS